MDWKESQLSLEPDLERTPIVGSDLDPQPWCKRNFFLIILCTNTPSSLIFVQSISFCLQESHNQHLFPQAQTMLKLKVKGKSEKSIWLKLDELESRDLLSLLIDRSQVSKRFAV